MSTAYKAIAAKGDRYWLVNVPEIGHTTQARRLSEIEPMARDLIAVMLDVDPSTITVKVDLQLPVGFTEHAQAAERLRTKAAEANTDAAVEIREAARALRTAGLGLQEIGEIMGVSYQRASQLLAS